MAHSSSHIIGAPTGLNTLPLPEAPAKPPVTVLTSGSQYLRFKRRNQTIFLHCEPSDLLSVVKQRLALVLGLDEEDVRLYEFMSAEKKAHVMAGLEERVREAAKLIKRKPGQPKPNLDEEIAKLEIPPLDEDKKLWELGLENDAIVFFVYRTHPKTDWDEWEEVDVKGLQEGVGKLLGSCAGEEPGGDGFHEPGWAARQAELAAKEAEEAAARALQAQRAEEEELMRAAQQAQQESEDNGGL